MARDTSVAQSVGDDTDWLTAAGLMTPDQLSKAVDVAHANGQSLRTVIDRLGLVSQKAWAEGAARAFDLEFIEGADFPDRLPVDARLSFDYLRRNVMAILSLEDEEPLIALADPSDQAVRQALAMAFGPNVKYVVSTERDIEDALQRLAEGDADTPGAADVVPLNAGQGDFDTDRLLEMANNAPTVRYLDWLFAKAVESSATDIHIEMLETKPRVRLRIDGVLVETQPIERHLYEGVVSRLKILAEMDISERRLPQDGSIRQKTAGRTVDIRVASAPTVHGEVIVLRLLDSSAARAKLDQLDLTPDIHKRLKAALSQPNGLILMTGPTGSGKTTTLHAGLAEINQVGRKIITIENPVEIQNPGLIQMEVKPDLGWSFASALRSVLRHDPDVLMVGEIRDGETAELAVRAALTGHLVLSTLHTNRAHEAVMRLGDMGVPDFLIGSVLRLAGAQRLVRLLCNECAEPVSLSQNARLAPLLDAMAQAVPEAGPPSEWTTRKSVGCEACGNSGFAGRRAVFEMVDPGRGETKPERSMGAEGIALFASGQTTLKELTSVFGSGKFWA
ncbi:MAG: GspE/PulE family protein [Pseudomonadota bacterium]